MIEYQLNIFFSRKTNRIRVFPPDCRNEGVGLWTCLNTWKKGKENIQNCLYWRSVFRFTSSRPISRTFNAPKISLYRITFMSSYMVYNGSFIKKFHLAFSASWRLPWIKFFYSRSYWQSTISEHVLKIFGQCQNCQN